MTPHVDTRPAKADDVPALVHLMLQYIVDFYHQGIPSTDEVALHIRHFLQHPREGRQFVAEVDGQLVGFVTLYFTYSTLRLRRIAVMNDLFVHTEMRGRKVGEQLFQTALSHSRTAGCAWMQWETTRDNHVAQQLYGKMGGVVSDLLVYEIDLESGDQP